MIKTLKCFFVLSILVNSILSAQIKVTPLPHSQTASLESGLFDKNDFRNLILLDSDWNVYHEGDIEKKVSVNVPAMFEGNESLVFEKSFYLSADQIKKKQIRLGFLGIKNFAEILINGLSIYKHSGGTVPFEINLPNDILKPDANNKLTVKVNQRLDSESTIPVLQRFLFPNVDGGLIRDVYLKLVPPQNITSVNYKYILDQQLSKAQISFNIGVENSDYGNNSGIQPQPKDLIVRVNLFQKGSTTAQAKIDFPLTLNSENQNANFQVEVSNPQLWSPDTPNNYTCEVSLISSGQIIDQSNQEISFLQLTKDNSSILLNKTPFVLKGTTYCLNETDLRQLNVYEKIKEDLSLIKSTGFNAVRFAKYYPHPYALEICRELGLIALVELPVNSIPEEILSKNEFLLYSENSLSNLISCYTKFSDALIIGTGSSFLPNSPITENYISALGKIVTDKKYLSYASFIGAQSAKIENVDFYGIELFAPPISSIEEVFKNENDALGKGSFFVSEVSYPNYFGGSTGYLTKYTSEAQAKYLDNFLNLAASEKLSGFFINSLYEFRGHFASLYAGRLKNNLYSIGILNSSRNLNSIGYKVLYSKLNSAAKVTIPIGTRKDDSPLSFILFALFLAIFMGALINTKKKFREDCTRALLRPYNFFADVRDHRIMSGIHTAIMMFIESGALALLFTIVLYYLKSSIVLEKILLAFGSTRLMSAISYLAWNPQYSFFILFLVFSVKFALIALLIKSASFFIRTRVEFTSIFYSVIWSFLPLTLLLPVELILYKIIGFSGLGSVLIVFFIIYFLWILQRLLKSIYVIFDVRQSLVYIYSLTLLILIAGLIIIKYQYTHSAIYYISNAIKQYNSMIF